MTIVQAINDWLLKTVPGVLVTTIIGGFLTIILWNVSSRLVKWSAMTLSPRFRSLSRRATEQRIEKLERLHDNAFQLLLEILLQLSIGLVGGTLYSFAITLLLLSRTQAHNSTVHTDIHSVILFDVAVSAVLIFGYIWILGLSSISFVQLYRDLRNYENTMHRLKNHLRSFDL
jgi:hypothetical protein